MYNFPETLFTGTRIHDPVFGKDVFIWKVDFKILQNYVADLQAGSWPDDSTGQSTSSTIASCP
jgi:hypothetical protein